MPNNWKTYKLGDVAEVQNGFAFKSADLGKEGIPVVKIKNIIPPYVDVSDADCFNGEIDKKLEKYILRKGDFLISMTGSTVNVMSSAVGKMGRYRLDQESLINQRAGKIYIKKPDLADFDFICHYLNRYEVHYNLALNATGSANQANISPAQIKDIDLLLPPLPEQQAIAAILSSLDDKIEMNLQMNKTLEEMAMTLYKHWFVDFGPFRPSLEGGACKAGGSGEFVDSELGLIPEGWEVKRLGEVVDTLGGGTPKTTVEEYWENGTIDWYSPTDLTKANSLYSLGTAKKITPLGLKKSSSRLFPKGSLLMSSRATIGAITINRKEACTNQGFITMIPNENVSLYQLHGWTVNNMDLIISKANGSTFKEISKSNFRDLFILLGKDLEEYMIDSEGIYSQIENNILENQTLTALRDTLLPKLISGEVRVKEAEQSLASIM